MNENILKSFGWLLFFGVVCVLFRIFSLYLRSKSAKNTYTLKSLMRNDELGIYKRIKQVLPQGTVLVPQVHYIEIIEPTNRGRQRIISKNKVDRKSIDYVVFDETKFFPLLAIELDGLSHLKIEKIKKDEFENKTFYEVGLPFIRIKYADTNDLEKLRNLIQTEISETKQS